MARTVCTSYGIKDMDPLGIQADHEGRTQYSMDTNEERDLHVNGEPGARGLEEDGVYEPFPVF